MFACWLDSIELLFELQLAFVVFVLHGDCSMISNDAVVECVCCVDDGCFLVGVECVCCFDDGCFLVGVECVGVFCISIQSMDNASKGHNLMKYL